MAEGALLVALVIIVAGGQAFVISLLALILTELRRRKP